MLRRSVAGGVEEGAEKERAVDSPNLAKSQSGANQSPGVDIVSIFKSSCLPILYMKGSAGRSRQREYANPRI